MTMTDSDYTKGTIRKLSKYKRDLSKFSNHDALSSEERSILESWNPPKWQNPTHETLCEAEMFVLGFRFTEEERKAVREQGGPLTEEQIKYYKTIKAPKSEEVVLLPEAPRDEGEVILSPEGVEFFQNRVASQKLEEIKKANPDAGLGATVIAGFD
jgi:hypothetical protein